MNSPISLDCNQHGERFVPFPLLFNAAALPLVCKTWKEKRGGFSGSTGDLKRDFLRHSLGTLAYRGGKAARSAPVEFADFQGAGRSPVQILAHIGDLLDWSLSMVKGKQEYVESQPLPW